MPRVEAANLRTNAQRDAPYKHAAAVLDDGRCCARDRQHMAYTGRGRRLALAQVLVGAACK